MRYDDILKAKRLEIRKLPEFMALEKRCCELRSAVMKPHKGAWKFLYPNIWMRQNLYRISRIGLDQDPPMKILDLGCGNGMFVYACNQFGHDATGLNCAETWRAEKTVFEEMPETLAIPIIKQKIVSQKPLELTDKFDLVTSFMTWFNIGDNKWNCDDWIFFLKDLRQHLADDGKIILHLNMDSAYGDYLYFDKETKALFLRQAIYFSKDESFLFVAEKLAML